MGAPPVPAPGGDIPMADLLSHGVEQGPPEGLSSGPMGAPAPQGIPFQTPPEAIGAKIIRGGPPPEQRVMPPTRFINDEEVPTDAPQPEEPPRIDLGDRFGGPFKGKPQSMADFAGVKSQGVPDGTVQRSPSTRRVMDTIDFPGGTTHRRIVENDSGSGPASLEAQRRLAAEKTAGTRPVFYGGEDEIPVLHDVTAVDRNPPKGHVTLDGNTGKLLNSGGMKPAAAQALVNRWKARRPIGEQF